MRKLRGLLEGQLHLTTHVLEQRLCRERIGSDQIPRQLEIDRERDQVLLRTVVEVALDPAAVCIVGDSQPLARGAQVVDLEAEALERLLRCLDMRKLRCPTSCSRATGSCPSSNRRRQEAQHPAVTGCQPPAHLPAATVVAAPSRS